MRVLRDGETILDREETARDATGRDTWRLVIKAPLKDHTGTVTGLVGLSQNIPRRKERDQMLTRSQEPLKLALTAARMGAWDWDLHTNTVQRSSECLSILGASAIDGDHAWFTRLLHPKDSEAFASAVRRAIAERSEFAMEYRVLLPGGKVRGLHDIGRTLYDESGTPVRMIGVVQDITDRKLAEEAVRQSREMLRLVLDNSPMGVSWKDRSSRYLGCNRVVARALGYDSPDALVGLTLADLPSVTPEQAAFFLQKDREVMDANAAQHHILEQLTLADGRTIRLDTSKVPLHDADGRVIGVMGTWEDITDRLRAEEELQFQNALLRNQAEASPDGILVVGPDNRVLSYNRRFLDISGIPKGLAAAGTDAPVLAMARSRTADPAAFAARVAAIYSDPDTHSHDEVALADGRTLDRYSGPIRGEGGKWLGRVWFFRDITARFQAEEAVRATAARPRMFVEHVSAPIAMFDHEMRYLHVSRRWLTDYSLGGRDLTGLSHYDVFPEVTERWKEIHRRCMAGAIERCDEDRFDRADGTVQVDPLGGPPLDAGRRPDRRDHHLLGRDHGAEVGRAGPPRSRTVTRDRHRVRTGRVGRCE
jgi:PAS domain S-box-containing protein